MVKDLANFPGHVYCERHGIGGRKPWTCPQCADLPDTRKTPSDHGAPTEGLRLPTSRERSGGSTKPDGSAAENELHEALTAAGFVEGEDFETQYRFAADIGRKFRADFAFPAARLLVESEGQAHSIRATREKDCRRASIAAALGWRMVRICRPMLEDGSAVELVKLALSWGRDR